MRHLARALGRFVAMVAAAFVAHLLVLQLQGRAEERAAAARLHAMAKVIRWQR